MERKCICVQEVLKEASCYSLGYKTPQSNMSCHDQLPATLSGCQQPACCASLLGCDSHTCLLATLGSTNRIWGSHRWVWAWAEPQTGFSGLQDRTIECTGVELSKFWHKSQAWIWNQGFLQIFTSLDSNWLFLEFNSNWKKGKKKKWQLNLQMQKGIWICLITNASPGINLWHIPSRIIIHVQNLFSKFDPFPLITLNVRILFPLLIGHF